MAMVKKWGGLVFLWMLVWGIVFFDSLLSAARVWVVNDTFNHCFFVLPAVLYATWQQRGAILRQPPGYSYIGLLGVLGLLFVYALGQAAYAELLQHLAIFGLIPAMALFLFGWRVIAVIWAPLAFTLFSLPVGEELIPWFQDITASMAVWMLKLIGVPVYRDGLYITVTNGHFVVAEACSGVRFFIACIVIGWAFAYMGFVSVWRALAFGVFSIVMPIVANGLRAFGIIYVGHVTDMQHAAGADHLIYGWFFFALVILLLILVGHWFSDGQRRWEKVVTTIDPAWQQRNRRVFLLACIIPFMLALGIKVVVDQQKERRFDVSPAALQTVTEQEASEQIWTPRFDAADVYRTGADPRYGVHFYQAVYFVNSQEREMLKWSQRFFELRKWTLKEQYQQEVEGLGVVTVSHLVALSGQQRLLAHWFVLPNAINSNLLWVKLMQAVNTLFLKPSGGALVAVSMTFSGPMDQAKARMDQTLQRSAVDLSQPIIVNE